jgi:tRNA 2-thiocytidine biosynthesis protein TtcA
MAKLEKRIARTIGKTIDAYGMIENGDRILACVSGGKDSLAMLWDLARRRRSFPFAYELEAFHLETDVCPSSSRENLHAFVRTLGVTLHLGYAEIMGRLQPGQKMSCYLCGTRRRIELVTFARERGFNKIALGHHLDDIIETFVMNLCYRGETSAMLPVIRYDRSPSITVIRPLAKVREDQIIRFVKEKGIEHVSCECAYGKTSKRKVVKAAIAELAKDNILVRYNIFASMHNSNPRFLPGEGLEGRSADDEKMSRSTHGTFTE